MMDFQSSMAPTVKRGKSWVVIDGKQYSYDRAGQILLEKGLVTKAHRHGRPYCRVCMLSYPKEIWGDIMKCPLCSKTLRENPRSREYKEKQGRTYYDLRVE